jgi:hypothetical protein
MCNVVTERFIKCHNALKEAGVIKSSRQFAINIEYLPQSLNEILKRNREVSVELIRKAIDVYHINAEYLFLGVLPMFKNEVYSDQNDEKSSVNSAPANQITYIPVSAQAGYSEQFNDIIFENQLIKFSLPDQRFNNGIFRCFDVSGDSMEPTLHSGDKVVCSLAEKVNDWSNIRDNYVYVVVLKDSIMIKRVGNHIQKNKTIQLLSDNDFYPIINVHIQDVLELWQVEVKISNFHPSRQNRKKAVDEEIKELNQVVSQQAQTLQNINITMEKLLKANRAKAFV